jgi:hypothetical protein
MPDEESQFLGEAFEGRGFNNQRASHLPGTAFQGEVDLRLGQPARQSGCELQVSADARPRYFARRTG